MADQDLVSSYLDLPAIKKQTQAFKADINDLANALTKLAKTNISFAGLDKGSAIREVSKQMRTEFDAMVKTTQRLEAENVKLNKSIQALEKTKQAEKKTIQETNKAKQEEIKLEQEVTKQIILEEKAEREGLKTKQAKTKESQNAAKAIANEAKMAEDATNDYLQLSKAYNDAALRAKNYSLRLGESHPVTVAAVKDAADMYKVLLRVDQSVGQSQRNVGNYKSAFDGLKMSFTQVARELPALAINAQTFLLAISNNLPMVIDEIRNAKMEIAALRAEGQEAPSLFKRIASSILSFNVIMSIGITILTLYGAQMIEWVGNLISGADAAKETAKAVKQLHEEQSRLNDLQDEYNKATNITTSGTDTRNIENEIARLKELGGHESEILKLEKQLSEQRKNIAQQGFENSGGQVELDKRLKLLDTAKDAERTFLRDHTNAKGEQLAFDSKAYTEEKDRLRANTEFAVQEYARQRAIVDEFYDANRDAALLDIKIQKQIQSERQKFFAADLQDQADRLKAASAGDGGSVNTLSSFRKKAFQLEKQILAGQRADEIAGAEGNATKLKEIDQQYYFDRKILARTYYEDLYNIQVNSLLDQKKQKEDELKMSEDFYKEQDAQREEAAKKAHDDAVNEYNDRVQFLQEGRDIELAFANRNGGSDGRALAERKLAIEKKYARAILQVQIELAEAELSLLNKNSNEYADGMAKVAAAKLRLSEFDLNVTLDAEAKKQKAMQKTIDMAKESFFDLRDLVGGLVNARAEREKNKVQEQLDNIDKVKKAEIDAINASTLSAQEKADKITAIEASAQTKREALEMRQRQIDEKNAKFQKMAAIATIILETSIAVSRALSDKTTLTYQQRLANAFSAGFKGAAQLAVAIATPVPKYKGGRENGPAEWAETGDGGVHEVITDANDGNPRLTPNTPTLTYLKKGEKVYRSIDHYMQRAAQRSYGKMSVNAHGDLVDDRYGKEQVRMLQRINQSINSRPENKTILTKDGLKFIVTNGRNTTEYLNMNGL